MELREYLDGLERGGVTRFAAALEVTPSYLSQLAAGTTPRSPARCVQIEKATGGKVTRKDLRPDDYHDIWPDLTDKAAA
jgi:DNA-binding transcriptional regulator YdaS (Cro superfamily)